MVPTSISQLEQATRYIGIDTNQANFFTAAIRNFTSFDQIRQKAKDKEKTEESYSSQSLPVKIQDAKKLEKDAVVCVGNSEWNEIRGSKQEAKKRQTNLSSAEQVLQDILKNDLMKTKTSSIDLFKAHINFITSNWNKLLTYYSTPFHRRSRMTLYIKGQQSWTYVRDKLGLKTADARKNTLLVIGEGNFPIHRGHAAVPSAEKLQHHMHRLGVRTVLVDEYRTSKLCSVCKTVVKEAHRPQHHVEHRFRIRLCPNKDCHTLWNRDVNACINMLDKYLNVAVKKPRMNRLLVKHSSLEEEQETEKEEQKEEQKEIEEEKETETVEHKETAREAEKE